MSDVISQLAALAGIDTLQSASFRGVKFECLSTRDTFARDTVSYAYPYRDGAVLADHGLRAVQFHMTVYFFGHDWKQQLKALLTTFKSAGTGELIHPVHGSIPRAQFMGAGVAKAVEPLDAVTIELTFTESGTEQALFAASSPHMALESVTGTGSHMLDRAASAFTRAMRDIRQLQSGVERVNTMVAQGEYLLNGVRAEVQGAAASVSNLLDTPSALVSDLRGIWRTFSDGLLMTHDGVKSSWSLATHLADKALTLPEKYLSALTAPALMLQWASRLNHHDAEQPGKPGKPAAPDTSWVPEPLRLPLNQMLTGKPEDTAWVVRTARLVTTSELSRIVSDTLTREAREPSLTSVQIESMVHDVRARIVVAINAEREVMQSVVAGGAARNTTADTRTHGDIITDLQHIAWTLQKQAMAVIQQRPPVIIRTVHRRANVHLLAFDWYGDVARAEELLRLNPSLSNPNDIAQGGTLYAFAR